MICAVASGLPPILSDEHFWDVQRICELKDSYIGTPEGDAYLNDVASGRRSVDELDIPRSSDQKSMLDVYYVVAKAKYKAGGNSLLNLHRCNC